MLIWRVPFELTSTRLCSPCTVFVMSGVSASVHCTPPPHPLSSWALRRPAPGWEVRHGQLLDCSLRLGSARCARPVRRGRLCLHMEELAPFRGPPPRPRAGGWGQECEGKLGQMRLKIKWRRGTPGKRAALVLRVGRCVTGFQGLCGGFGCPVLNLCMADGGTAG